MQESETAAPSSDARLFRDIFQASPIGIAVETLEGQPLFANDALCSMLGFSEKELHDKHCVDFSPAEDAQKDWALFQQLKDGSIDHYAIDKRYLRRDGAPIWGRLSVSLLNGRPSPLVLAMVQDITERKRAEEALRDSEAQFRSVFREAGVGMVIVSPEGRYLSANQTFCDSLGYTEQELLEKTVESITFPEDWPAFQAKLQEAERDGHGFMWLQKRCLHKSGRIVYTESSTSVIRNHEGDSHFFVAQVIDITSRRKAEMELAEMSRKLIQAQEQERARIARELHDDICQRLAMACVDVQLLKGNQGEIETRAERLMGKLSDISNDLQALSHELHSSKLEYLGVVTGIKSWCNEFAELAKLRVDFTSNVSDTIPVEIGYPLLRVVQQAAHNAKKHSGASLLEVKLKEGPGEIYLTIGDSGRGFDVEEALQGKGLGLTSMKERVRLIHGTIEIDSKPGQGTTIRVRVPLG